MKGKLVSFAEQLPEQQDSESSNSLLGEEHKIVKNEQSTQDPSLMLLSGKNEDDPEFGMPIIEESQHLIQVDRF